MSTKQAPQSAVPVTGTYHGPRLPPVPSAPAPVAR